jgi:DNA-binding CsgD family transcriptional regulator/GAF domain-containing protein
VDETRLRRLIDAGIAMSAELSVEAVRRQLVEQAKSLTEARLASIEDVQPGGVLSVPIGVRGAVYGYLCLEGESAREDEEIAALLAAQAAVAIENARRYESATGWLHQLEALTEVSNALASDLELSHLLQLAAQRLRELIGARLVVIALPTGDGDLEFKAADGELAAEVIGSRLPQEGSKTGRVFGRRRSERVDSLIDDVEAYQPLARQVEARAALYVPMLVGERAIGILVAVNKVGGDDRFSDDDLRLAEAFAARAAIAVGLSERLVGGEAAEPGADVRESGLTARESDVLRLVAMGLSDSKIAERLVISERTVHSHLRSIYRKLDVTSRSAATRYAVEHHLV